MQRNQVVDTYEAVWMGVEENDIKSFAFAPIVGVIAIVLVGGYIVVQSTFRISINDKIQGYGQLRTIGAMPKQVKRIVKREVWLLMV